MPPKNINDFFSPVSTGTNPHQQIDDLILMEELDKIAQENMMYGAMTQFQPDVHAPTVTPFALDAELAPLKAMGWLLGKGKGIKDVLRHSKRTIYDLLNLDVPGFFSVQPYARKNPKVNPMGKWIDMDTSSRLAQDVAEDLPDVANIERKAERLRYLEEGIENKKGMLIDEAYQKFLDDPRSIKALEKVLGKGAMSRDETMKIIERMQSQIKAENLRPGAGLTEPYHISYPHSTGDKVIPFDPIEVHKGYDMTEKGGKEFIAKHGEEAWQKEVSAYKKSQEDLEDLKMVEIENASQTLGDELSWWFEEEAIKRNIDVDDSEAVIDLIAEFPHIDKLLKSKYMLKEMELRQEIRWEQQKTLRDILEGKPY